MRPNVRANRDLEADAGWRWKDDSYLAWSRQKVAAVAVPVVKRLGRIRCAPSRRAAQLTPHSNRAYAKDGPQCDWKPKSDKTNENPQWHCEKCVQLVGVERMTHDD